jgi:hypothetical protein
MFAFSALKYWIYDKHFHPDTADPASFQKLVLYFALFMLIDFIASTIAFSLERRRPGFQARLVAPGPCLAPEICLPATLLRSTGKDPRRGLLRARALPGTSWSVRATVKAQPVPVGASRGSGD